MRIVSWAIASTVAILIAGAGAVFLSYGTDGDPERHSDHIEHFKYGSIGAEVGGYPHLVWRT